MTEAQKILAMIETVDPSETLVLDAIDARVWCWLIGDQFLEFDRFGNISFTSEVVESLRLQEKYGEAEQYTRSRDALKAIRPEGVWFEILVHPKILVLKKWISGKTKMTETDIVPEFTCRCRSRQLESPILPTEELAELHAIIQAIAYERGER